MRKHITPIMQGRANREKDRKTRQHGGKMKVVTRAMTLLLSLNKDKGSKIIAKQRQRQRTHDMRDRKLGTVSSISLHSFLHTGHFILSINTYPPLAWETFYPTFGSRTGTQISHLSNPQWFTFIMSYQASRTWIYNWKCSSQFFLLIFMDQF